MPRRKSGNGFVASHDVDDLARGLGWFSIAIGLAELLAPRRLGRTIGAGDHPALMRLCGLREITSGIGILTRRNPSPWLWARFAGDIMDVALLGTAIGSEKSKVGRLLTATAAVAGVTAFDWKAGRRFSQRPGANISAVRVTRAITVDRPASELFEFWRNFENLPRFMAHLRSVTVKDDRHSHWVAKGPAGTDVEWDAEIVNEHPNEMIAWRSLAGSDVETAGSVRFDPATGGRGTVVKVELKYDPPAGVLGVTVAKLFGQSPDKQVAVDLMQFKQVMETGEIARTEGQPSGRVRRASKFDTLVQK